ncbi:uncharacterized protein LOC119682288 isoform X1 [Teleopsis dalmanni]|uniref:uncharacterized protein LOC119682288 isoform X1 n=1 Tax=Teleopsis dalmanni TaxID=139649 RepID=UPI0018CD2490|nr:uncharacterized protein LOC119682288 isoform X1 [Teleopsis dalmanni]
MAYINVAEWTPDQVTDWLKGLDDSMYKYVHSFTNNEVGGKQLLNIRPYELEQLGMFLIGHQEIVLEAVENLRNFHFNLDKENLQFMALHVATAARSLYRQLQTSYNDASKIETKILNDITRTIGTIKPLIAWLNRAPFRGQKQFTEICRNMLRLGLEMATIAQRDRFVEKPVEQIRNTAEKLERLANYIIQDITDPMLLQPAALNLVTLKKRESELGFNIEPTSTSFHGVHRVTDIKYNSPAHHSGKIEDGDEIVQINYQTVVGWQYKTVLMQLQESLPDVLITLKKRPKHTKIYGQIYMQPYRLPSKKRAIGTRWGENLPSPRAGFLTVPDGTAFNMPISLKAEEKNNAQHVSDTDSSCSDISTPTDAKASEKEIRLYYPKPRAMLQRRNTICGDEFLGLKCGDNAPLWHERKTGAVCDPASPSLRDKSISFGFGLEITPRPTTCIGIAGNSSNKFSSVFSDTKKLRQVPEVVEHKVETKDDSKPGISKVVRFDANMKYEDYPVDEKYTCNVENTLLETFEPILFVDEEDDALDKLHNFNEKSEDILEILDKKSNANSTSLTEAVNMPLITRRGRLDKSHSTPAYDNSGEESDTPPAIEPRKEFLLLTPPVPPPRPRKQKDLTPPIVPPPPPKPASLMSNPLTPPPLANSNIVNDLKSNDFFHSNVKMTQPAVNVDAILEVNELHTPTKSRTLTLKKKHSLVLKRRNVNLKILGTGDIQGHLYRRTKDRRGVTFWARFYFVMLDTILYGFRLKEAIKASCVIFLPGFTVSLAKEVHSKPFAFKVYHSAKTFYFAAESLDALNQWIDFIRQATLQSQVTTNSINRIDSINSEANTKDLFSETDSSGEESESVISKNLCTPSPQATKDNTTSSISSKSFSTPTAPAVKQDRRYLGSLRKLTKGTLPFKSSSTSEKKSSSDIPVPTEQYRSYRKVPGGSFGIQIGTNTPGYHDTSLHPFNTVLNCNTTPEIAMPERKYSISTSSVASNSDSNITLYGPPSSPAPAPTPTLNQSIGLSPSIMANNKKDHQFDSPTKSIKKIPYNFIHASNPNLVEFDFQTSKTLDYSLPKINPSNSWDAHQNVQGFVTLKDLMLQKQEEEAQEMYNNRVLLGVEKKDERKRNAQRRLDNKQQDGGNAQMRPEFIKLSKTQSRSLPKTPDYEISFKPDDEDIKRTRTKEGLKLRDFGYELISGDEPITNSTTARQNSNTSNSSADQQHEHMLSSAVKTRQFLKTQPFLPLTQKTKKHSTSSADFVMNEKRTGSFKKKGKFDVVKTSSERIFQFSKHATSSSSAMTMTLPLNKKNGNRTDESRNSGGIKKSHTYNTDLKDKLNTKYDAQRKNSAPMPIFSKLSFSSSSTSSQNNKPAKEKKLLGSPLLHRTIFGNQHHNIDSPTCTGREYDREIFTQVIFPRVPNPHSDNTHKARNLSTSNTNITAPDILAPPPPTIIQTPPLNTHDRNSGTCNATPDYPSMENILPPVFQPEIYSLSDPNASITLLLRRNNSSGTDERN